MNFDFAAIGVFLAQIVAPRVFKSSGALRKLRIRFLTAIIGRLGTAGALLTLENAVNWAGGRWKRVLFLPPAMSWEWLADAKNWWRGRSFLLVSR
jgi:hypothetical protein